MPNGLHRGIDMGREHALTLKFRGVEAELLSLIVDLGICNTKAEAIRSSLINWGKELGLYDEALGRHTKGMSLNLNTPARQSNAFKKSLSLDDLEREFSD